MSQRFFVSMTVAAALLFALSSASAAQSKTEILYVQQNTSLLTYNIDPTTLQATLVGQPLPRAGYQPYVRVFQSPNGHFIYVLWGPQELQMSVSVYATDSSGVPQLPALQTIGPAGISDFTIDPKGDFAYLIQYTNNANLEFYYKMWLFSSNANGVLTKSSKPQITFPPTYYCNPIFEGFYPNASQMQYAWLCPGLDPYTGTFYSRSVNAQTGALGSAQVFFSFSDDGFINGDIVRLGYRSINDWNLNQTQMSMKIYSPHNGKTPLIDCNSAMLAACGETNNFWQDATGEYLFLAGSNATEMVKIDYAAKQIVDTGYSFDGAPVASPDDSVLYGGCTAPGCFQLYGFDPTLGVVTTGGQFSVAPTVWNIFPAVRD